MIACRWRAIRRQLNPMEQARLIRRLKEEYGILNGKNDSSVKMTEVAQMSGVGQETAKRLNRLNALIPPLYPDAFPPSALVYPSIVSPPP